MTTTTSSAAKGRITVVFALLLVALAALVIKAGRLQLVLGDDLRALAENQYLRRVPVAAPRGAILDRDGRPLAMSLPAWSVGVRPAQIVDKRAAAAALAGVLALPEAEVAEKLAGTAKFTWLKRRATGDVADGVRALGLPGVELKQEMRRMWPHKQLAGQLLGLVDVDGRARGGVEQTLDDSLQGRSSTAPALADNKGDRIALASGLDELDLELLEGDDVVLTIDASLQHEAEAALVQTLADTNAKAAWAIAMDARTGALRAVAHAPTFNPNAPDPATARNKAFAEAFEPGSIFKVATFAAALDAGELRPDDRIYCENGRYELGKHVIHDTHKAEWLTATEVFAQSSNIGTLKIAQRVGEDRLKAALSTYGFGARPGTKLVEEAAGRLPGGRWGDARLATVSFGHGMLVSALQMASFVQAVANDGVRRAPYLVEEVRAPSGEVVTHAGARADDGGGERILGAATARTLTNIMKTVVADGGTGSLAAIPGIEVAGKTGTAEKVDPVTKRYSRDLNLSSFVGFAPADDPRIVVIVIVDEPRGSHFGGVVASPAWRRIVEHALVEDGVLGTGALTAPKLVASRITEASKARAAEGGHVAAVGDKTAPVAGLLPAKTGGAPDLRGLTARAAVRRAEEASIDVALSGSGVVVAQEPAPGAALGAGKRLKLVLSSTPIAATKSAKVAHKAGGPP